jgi:hypothetical protein
MFASAKVAEFDGKIVGIKLDDDGSLLCIIFTKKLLICNVDEFL